MRALAIISCAILMGMTGVAMAASRQVEIIDYTGRGFAPDVVNYQIDTRKLSADKICVTVTTSGGSVIASQLSPPDKAGMATLSFVAEVAPNGKSVYTISDEGGAATTQPAVQASAGDEIILTNGFMAVACPKAADAKFSTPVPADTLPAPILRFRSGAGGPWLGAGKMLSKRLVKAHRVALVTQGPVFAQVRYEIEWAEGGYYRADIRVAQQMPLAQVTEEYDLGKMTEGDFWQLNLTQGWSPDTAEVAKTWGNGGVDAGRNVPIAEVKLHPIQPYGAYGNMQSQLGLFNAEEAKAKPGAYTMAGVVPLHMGNWRRTAMLDVDSPDGNKTMLVRFPMTRQPPRWIETSPFCVVTHEDALPYTYARRVWGLLLAAAPVHIKADGRRSVPELGPFYEARCYYGIVGLDRYKDFITQWPDGKPEYPRSFMRKDELKKIRASLDGSPFADEMKKEFSVLSGDEKTAKRNLESRELDQFLIYLMVTPTPSHHRMFMGPRSVIMADDALAWPGITPEQRDNLRARLAVFAYLMTEADLMGNGNGEHTGNPNMSIARQLWMPTLVALLPDHPMYEKWRQFYAQLSEHKYADNMAPGGGWFEFGGYHMWGYARNMQGLFGQESVKAPNLARLAMYNKADFDYFTNLLTPVDTRYGARLIPGLGNSGNLFCEHFLEGAGSMANLDPAFASQLMWAWQANGSQSGYLTAAPKPWVQPKEPKLTSRVFPGFGVIFRAHQGPDETYLALRSGYLWSHWYVDQNHMLLYSKGAALLPGQPYAYYDSPIKDHSQYNDIRFGDPTNQYHYGWPDSNILDYHLGERVQYAWSSAGYPAWYIKPGRVPGYGDPPVLKEGIEQKEGDFTWDRRVVFMVGKTPKSPNYFIIRDSVSGPGELAQWFNLNLVGRKSDVQVQGDRLGVNTEFDTKLDVVFPGVKSLKPDMAEDDTLHAMQGNTTAVAWARLTKDAPASPRWKRKDGKAVSATQKSIPDIEEHVIVRIPSAPGADHFWILYPRGQAEAAPKAERLAANVVKVTHAEGTDYVMLAPVRDKFEGEGVVMEGTAAAVRVVDGNAVIDAIVKSGKAWRGPAPNEITLALFSGAGRVAYKNGSITGMGPLEKTMPSSDTIKTAATSPVALPIPVIPMPGEPVAPGIARVTKGDTTQYLIDSPTPVSADDGQVHLEGRKAAVHIGADGIRFVAPEATYVKLTVGTVGVRGVGPFDLTFTPDAITGTVDGKMRTIVVTKPAKIIRPMFHLDDVRWYAGYADDTAPFRGRSDPQFSLAFGTLDGSHKVDIREWTSPQLPPPPPRTVVPMK